MLNRVEGLAESSLQEKSPKALRKHKRSARPADRAQFENADLLDYLPPNSPPGAGSDGVKYAVQVRNCSLVLISAQSTFSRIIG